MTKKTAAWRGELTDSEAQDLDRAAKAKASAVQKYNALFKRLKNRCIQRLRAKKGAGE